MVSSQRFVLVAFLLGVMLLAACTPTTEVPEVTQGPQLGAVVPYGTPIVRDLAPITEVVSNCAGVTSPVIKNPAVAVGSTHAVEWQIGGTIGTGVTIGGGVVPGGVDLQAALEGHVANSITTSAQQSEAWELPADPGMIMEYTIMWREVWQPAYIDVTFMDPEPEILRIDVAYRTGVQSEKVGEKATLCDPGSEVTEVAESPTGTDTLPPTTINIDPATRDPVVAPIPPATTIEQAESTGACGPAAFDSLMTSNPIFTRPVGMQSGWLSSDPATIQLADGTQMRFDTQFVLVVEDVPQVQVLGVGTKPTGEANTWGCWFLTVDSQFAEEGARRDFQIKIDGENRAVLYRVSSAGFEPMTP